MGTLLIPSILQICGDDVIAVCITVLLVACIVSFTFCKWQKIKYKGLAEKEKQELKDEIEEDFKQELKKYSLIWKSKDETLEELTKREKKELRFKTIDELSNICKAGIQKNVIGNMEVYSNIVNKIFSIYQEGIGIEKDERESTESNTSN
jgi:hypothetical protein